MRSEMYKAASWKQESGLKRCRGEVKVQDKHWQEAQSAAGNDQGAQRNYLLAEAQQGCTQKCGCDESAAPKFETRGNDEYIVATCNQSPNSRDLGSTIM